jgi:NAD(P)H-nitrite reductase large subunit
MPFDKLILATGGEAVMPPIEGVSGPGVLALKTLGDADKLARFTAKEAVVVGSGPTGIETAIALRKRGMRVFLVELLPSVLPTVLDRDVGARVEDMLTTGGIRVITGERVTQVLRRQGKVHGVETDRRNIECQLVVFAVGVRPRTALVGDTAIAAGPLGGICVNEGMETSVPGVYACGDCAEFLHPADGKSVLQLFWLNARQMGRVAGARCAGSEATYNLIQPGTVLNVFGTTVGSIGATSTMAGIGTRIVEREAGNIYARFHLKGGSMVGAQFIGKLEEAGPVATMIRTCCPVEQLADRIRSFPISYKYHRLIEGWG